MQDKFPIPGDLLKVPNEMFLALCYILHYKVLECLLSEPELGWLYLNRWFLWKEQGAGQEKFPVCVTARASSLWQSVITWDCQHRARLWLQETPPTAVWSVSTVQGTGFHLAFPKLFCSVGLWIASV